MNSYLRGKTVYLCGPITAVKDDGIGWRKMVKPRLEEFGINVLDPCRKTTDNSFNEVGSDKVKFKEMVLKESWGEVKNKFWPIVRYDLRCVDHCDFIVFKYDPDVPMVGSIHELVVATFEKKTILLKYERSQLNSFNPWIATFVKEHHFFAEWEDMYTYLKKVDEGIFDTSLWVI